MSVGDGDPDLYHWKEQMPSIIGRPRDATKSQQAPRDGGEGIRKDAAKVVYEDHDWRFEVIDGAYYAWDASPEINLRYKWDVATQTWREEKS